MDIPERNLQTIFNDTKDWVNQHRALSIGAGILAVAGIASGFALNEVAKTRRGEAFDASLRAQMIEKIMRSPDARFITITQNEVEFAGQIIQGVAIDPKSEAMSLAAASSGLTKCWFAKVEPIKNIDSIPKGYGTKTEVNYFQNQDFKAFRCREIPKMNTTAAAVTPSVASPEPSASAPVLDIHP